MARRNAISVTFYGGVNEIGGNKILLRDHDTNLLFDFGMSYSERRKFYAEPWLSPRDEVGLMEFGILPRLDGLYRFDTSPPSIDAVFISHAHGDHCAYISFLKREIPVYCGETAATIIQATAETRPRDFERDISGIRLRTFHTGSKIRIGSVEVLPCHVDHSVPGAYGFVAHTSEATVAYSGDLRMHGAKSEMTKDFVDMAAKANTDVLMAEGTNIMGADVSSEREVGLKVNSVVAGTPKLVLADFSYVDVDRFRTFHDVAKKNGRSLAISPRQAHVLAKLKREGKVPVPDIRSDGNVLIYRRSKKRYFEWEERILRGDNVREASDIRKIQSDVVLVSSFYDLKELVDIRPESGSNFILSISEPFNEEQEIEFERVKNWLDHFGMPMYHIHCSGHIMPNELRWLIGQVKPKELYTIHTEHPELYSKFVSGAWTIITPQRGFTYPLT